MMMMKEKKKKTRITMIIMKKKSKKKKRNKPVKDLARSHEDVVSSNVGNARSKETSMSLTHLVNSWRGTEPSAWHVCDALLCQETELLLMRSR